MKIRSLSGEEIAAIFALLIIGVSSLLLLYRMSPNYFQKQASFWLIGIILYLLIKTSTFHPKNWQKADWFIYLAIIILLIVPIFFGQNIRGSSRWITMGSFSFQPSEITKPFFVFAITSFCLRWQKNPRKHLILSSLLSFFPAILILIQPDLGSAFVFLAGAVAAILLSSKRKKLVLKTYALLAVIGLVAATIFLPYYQKERIVAFLNPQKDPLGSGYNLIQSKIAIGSGQWLGRGFGTGEQTRLMFLPEKHTDFIFASFAEASGLAGVIVILVAYLIMFLTIRHMIIKTDDKFGSVFKTALFLQIWLQAVINIAMNLGLAPITGLPLPFFSYGGSSIIASFISLAFIFK